MEVPSNGGTLRNRKRRASHARHAEIEVNLGRPWAMEND
jgi:hypothetical protein